jgi:Fic-DOC domain mobile mystery protein B
LTDIFREPDAATPLTPEERDGLIPTHIALRRELNDLEQQNILDADLWAFRRRRDPVSEPFGRRLHRRMFGRVWRWAGVYRSTDKNTGVAPTAIHQRLYAAYDDFGFWQANDTYPPDQLAVRFHHTLVVVHPFANGNGRWSRLMTDILLARMGQSRFTYGSSSLRSDDETRRSYVQALRAADQHDFTLLVTFARS